MVGEAGDLASIEATVATHRPRVLVLDVNLPDGLAVDVVPELREASPETEIVLLTMERDLTLARRALDAGAKGYLFKDAAHLELIEAVRAAAAGEQHLAPAVAAGLKNGEADDERVLSPRETDVLQADGPRPHQPRNRRSSYRSASARSRPTGRTSSRSSGSPAGRS